MPSVTLIQQFCLRCQHTWYPRSEKKPVQCPKCTSRVWFIPRPDPPTPKTVKPCS